jgi:hypothetical protein
MLTMSNDLVTRNAATNGPAASGGGIDNSGKLTLTDSVLSYNVARGVGGGLQNEEQAAPPFVVVVRRTKVIYNTVTSPAGPATGGGIYNAGVMSLTDSSVRKNNADAQTGRAVGAGIYNADSLSLSGTSITNNLVRDQGGEAEGGGLYVDEGSKRTALDGSTITYNTAAGPHAHGGGIFFAGGAPVRLTNSVVARNVPDNCFPPGSVVGCHG